MAVQGERGSWDDKKPRGQGQDDGRSDTSRQQDRRGRPRNRWRNPSQSQQSCGLQTANSFSRESSHESPRSCSVHKPSNPNCDSADVSHSVTGDSSLSSVSVTDTPRESNGVVLGQFLSLVRVSTAISTASTELASNTSPSNRCADKQQSESKELPQPNSSNRSWHPSSTPPKSVCEKRMNIPLCRESPGESCLLMYEVDPDDPTFLDERTASYDSQPETGSAIEFTAEHSDCGPAWDSAIPSSPRSTPDSIREHRIQRNVKMIGKTLNAPSEDDPASETTSCLESEKEASVIDLTMYKEKSVIACLSCTDSSSAGSCHDTKGSISDSTLTCDFGFTAMGTVTPVSPAIVMGGDVMTKSPSTSMSSEETARQTIPLHVSRGLREKTKNNEYTPGHRGKDSKSSVCQHRRSCEEASLTQHHTGWSLNSAAAFFSNALVVSRSPPPVANIMVHTKKPIPRDLYFDSHNEEFSEGRSTTKESISAWMFNSKVFLGVDGGTGHENKASDDSNALLRPGDKQAARSAGVYLARLSPTLSPLSSVAGTLPDPTDKMGCDIDRDEERPPLDGTAPADPSGKRLRKVRVKRQPASSCWLNSWFIFCLLFLIGTTSLILVGLDLAGSNVLGPLTGRGDGETPRKTHPSPTLPPPEGDIFVGAEPTILARTTSSPTTQDPAPTGADSLPNVRTQLGTHHSGFDHD